MIENDKQILTYKYVFHTFITIALTESERLTRLQVRQGASRKSSQFPTNTPLKLCKLQKFIHSLMSSKSCTVLFSGTRKLVNKSEVGMNQNSCSMAQEMEWKLSLNEKLQEILLIKSHYNIKPLI